MNLTVPGTLALRARLGLAAFGWSNLTVTLVCALGAAVWLVAIPHASRALADTQALLVSAQALLSAAQTPNAAPAPPAASTHLKRFHEALGEADYPEQQIKTLLALAGKTGVTLGRAEYKYARDRQAVVDTVGITLPVSGSYAAIREFCLSMLLAIPFASLDDLTFKRPSVAGSGIEASLHFTLYLGAPGPSGAGAAP